MIFSLNVELMGAQGEEKGGRAEEQKSGTNAWRAGGKIIMPARLL